MVLKKIGIASLAKVSVIIHIPIGLLVGCVLMIIALCEPACYGSYGAGVQKWLGLYGIITWPLIYGIYGLIVGLYTGIAYNAITKLVGGVNIELEQ
ncbi:MAG: hypothetical protein JSW34_12310 [Candidatus Zixiibacteriota bacterium]|nr:MAG: hypothetical protein JSW34_12310 [candidate division Zixibacteria bacterium]